MEKGRNRVSLFVCFVLLVVCDLFLTRSFTVAEESGTFSGTWSASGERELLSLGDKRTCALFKLKGHVNLKDGVGKEKDYWSTCIGLADSDSGSAVRCVWRSSDDHEIYIVLRSDKLENKHHVQGEIIGGSGVADGITGRISFTWSTLTFQKENESRAIGGFAKDLQGEYHIP